MTDNHDLPTTAPSSASAKGLITPELWALMLLAVLGVFFFFVKFEESFPSASIDLKLSKAEVLEKARKWSVIAGYEPDAVAPRTTKAIQATIFSFDDYAKTFIEHELDQKRANALMKSEIPIWYWSTRFCRQQQQEECSVWISPEGTLRSFRHDVPNDVAMPSLTHEQAETVARDFVEKTVGLSLKNCKQVKEGEQKQVKRTDHYFTWEDQSKEYKGARLRTYVWLSGDKVTEYNTYLYEPEKFTRKYNEIRSWNNLLKNISSIIFQILQSAIVFAFFWAFASGRVRWRLAIVVGVVASLVDVLNWFNNYPYAVYGFDKTKTFQAFLGDQLVSMLINGAMAAIGYVIMVGGLEAFYRIQYPGQVALENLGTRAGLRTRQVLRVLLAGAALLCIHGAYVVAYYLIGQKVGIWSPLELRDPNTLGSYFPVFSDIAVGVSASSTEELMYRIFALGLFSKLLTFVFERLGVKLPVFWIANILQAVSWAFMHSDYPQEPAFARGLELSIVGTTYGYILRKYGLAACVLSHYTYDAFIGVTALFSTPDIVQRLSTYLVLVPLVPLIVASVWMIYRHGVNEDEAALTNATLEPKKDAAHDVIEEPLVHWEYKPISNRWRMTFVIAAVVCTLVRIAVPIRTVGALSQVKLNAAQAMDVARDYLRSRGINFQGKKVAAYITDTAESEMLELQYVFEQVKYRRTNELAKLTERPLVWVVRFFKPLDPEEFHVTLEAAGKPIGMTVTEEEDAPGESLSQDAARQRVEKFLHSEHPELEPYVFYESKKEERKKRTDWDFTYKVPHLKVGDADFKVTTGTIGGMVSGFSSGWQIPDKWRFEKEREKPKDVAVKFVRYPFWIAVAIGGLIWVVGVLRSQAMPWRAALILAVGAFVISIGGELNQIPTFFSEYDTDVPISTFITNSIIRQGLGGLSSAVITALIAAFAIAAYRIISPKLPLRAILDTTLNPHPDKRQFWLDALILGYCGTIIASTSDHLFEAGRALFSPNVKMIGLDGISAIGDEWSPAVGGILTAVITAVTSPLTAAIAVGVCARFFKSRKWLFAALMVAVLINHSTDEYWQDYVFNVGDSVVSYLFIFLFITKFARFNIMAYVLSSLGSSLLGTVRALTTHGLPLYYANVVVLVSALIGPAAYIAWLWANKSSPQAAGAPEPSSAEEKPSSGEPPPEA
jgi:hypothetical protein